VHTKTKTWKRSPVPFPRRYSPTLAYAISLLRFLGHIQLDTQPVGLLSTSNQFDAGPLLTQHTTKEKTKIHALSGIRTRDRINRRAAKISPLLFSIMENYNKYIQIIS
jgi:hypothetical protein